VQCTTSNKKLESLCTFSLVHSVVLHRFHQSHCRGL